MVIVSNEQNRNTHKQAPPNKITIIKHKPKRTDQKRFVLFFYPKTETEERKMLKNYKSFELLEQYLSYLTVIKGRSINTVIEYRTDVLMFFEFLCNKRNMEREKYDLSMIDNEFVRSVTLNDMYAFISHCQTESKAAFLDRKDTYG